MKAKVILSILATVFTLSVNASGLNASTFATGDRNSHRTLYTNTSLSESVKWECDYDAYGRVVTKTAFVYNAYTGEWMPRMAYSVFYGADETIVTTAQWDAERHGFRSNVIQQRYNGGYCPEFLITK